jgi:hypothetical protein
VLERAGQSRLLRFNEVAAERLREAAILLAHQGDNPYRVAAYRRAADAVAALTADLRELLDTGGIKALEEIPGVGSWIAGGLVELVRTGRWTYLERLRGSGEPDDVFCTIPGVGPILAKRLHETLHVDTLEQLEAALHEHNASTVAGIGPRRLAIVRAALSQMLARIRPVRTGPYDEPSAHTLLDVDREYRTKAAANELRKIAPSGSIQRQRLGSRSSIRPATNGISPHCSQTRPAPMSFARFRIGSSFISIPTAAARRSAPSSPKRAARLPDNASSAAASASVLRPMKSLRHEE